MKAVRWFIAAIVTALSLGAMALLSAAPVRSEDSESARLRLSWSARPERIETCRVLSKFATYALDVFVDGRLVHQSVVRGAGLRHDRPIFLLREIPVPPGAHRIRVSFDRREKTDNDAAAFFISKLRC